MQRTEVGMKRTSRFILLSLILAIYPRESSFASMAYRTLYQNLIRADVVVASVIGEHVDSLSTLYLFRIYERLTETISDSVIPVITFMGKNIWVEHEERFTVGSKYLLLLYRGGSAFGWDPVRSKIYKHSNAFRTVRSFPESRRDFIPALEATRILIMLRTTKDTNEVKYRFLHFLASQNEFLITSAIEEITRTKDMRALLDLRRLSINGTELVRDVALRALFDLNGKDEAPTYLKAIRDSSYLVRQAGLANLLWSKVFIPQDTLLRIALDRTEMSVNRAIAIKGLLIERCTDSIPILERLLQAEPKDIQLKQTLPRVIDSLRTFLKR